MAEVKLFGMWASPFSCRIQIALKLKEIQHEYIEEDLPNKSALLLKYNPIHKQVPVFVHNGKPISESLVILEYIDETWQDNPLLPKDPYDKAMARFWVKFVDEKILQTASKMRMSKSDQELEQLHPEFIEDMQWLENELKGKDFFGGEKIGYVDIVAFVIAHWFEVLCHVLQTEFITEEKFPVLHKWLKKLREIDVIREHLPPRAKHVALMKAGIEALKCASK